MRPIVARLNPVVNEALRHCYNVVSTSYDIRDIKISIQKIDAIEKTVNIISAKVSSLEMKVNSVDSRVTEVEKSVSFISEQNDSCNKSLKTVSDNLNEMKKTCSDLKRDTQNLKESNIHINDRVTELECRSMRDNLIFYGIPESQNEDCEKLIKSMCVETMNIDTAAGFTVDRAHRLGSDKQRKPRPVVVKFHYPKEREIIRQKSFDRVINDRMRQQNLGVGEQWPKHVRDTRRELRPLMQREKEKGNNVRLVRDKLFVNGKMIVKE